jgi:hypothetical protein
VGPRRLFAGSNHVLVSVFFDRCRENGRLLSLKTNLEFNTSARAEPVRAARSQSTPCEVVWVFICFHIADIQTI